MANIPSPTREAISDNEGDIGRESAPEAASDPLVAMPDYVLFRDRLTKAISGACRDGRATGVFYVGIAGMDAIKERHGDLLANQVQRVASRRLTATVRKADTVARLADDHFGIVQVRLESPQGCYALARRLIAAMAHPVRFDGIEIEIGVSIGIAFAESDDEDAECWLQQARLAQQKAELDSPGSYRCANPELDAQLQVRMALEADLRQAIAAEELELHYQPIVQLGSRHVVAFEALLRWQHPTRGFLMPSDFLHVAEDTGLMCDLGCWVLRRACSNAIAWPSSVKVAVNLSLAQFRQSNIVQTVGAALQGAGLDPTRLILEINEDILVRSNERALPTLHALKSLGVSIAMDDFGTGRSSLSHLQSFPFDRIKIDQSLMSKTENQLDAAPIVRAVISVGRSLGMIVTAEGVETEQQLAFLLGEGCDEVQGFYFSRPMPNSDVERLITLIGTQERPPATTDDPVLVS